MSEEKLNEMIYRGIIAIAVIPVLLIIFFNTVIFVKTGEIGVVTKFGAVQDKIMTAGINIKIPFLESVKIMNCKTQKFETEQNGASKDLQDVMTKVAINYNVNAENANKLYKEVGQDYTVIILEPTLINTVKSTIAEYTAEELITKRAEVTNKINTNINNQLLDRGITITGVNIVDLNFSEAFNKAIEEKQVAEQNVKKAQQELEKIKIESEQKITQAQAEAEALKVQKQEITQDLLELRKIEAQQKAIEKWDGILPQTMTGDTIPFLNIDNSRG